jgi:hypothetical protein
MGDKDETPGEFDFGEDRIIEDRSVCGVMWGNLWYGLSAASVKFLKIGVLMSSRLR